MANPKSILSNLWRGIRWIWRHREQVEVVIDAAEAEMKKRKAQKT